MTKSIWNSNNIPDQSGRTDIVTGATSGIGLETALVLTQKGAQVIIGARNATKAEAVVNHIKKQAPAGKITSIPLDLASLSSVKNFVDLFKDNYSRLDLLINNAGVMVPPYTVTKDGFELQIGTNHLGHFALTGRLIDLIKNTPGSRIVVVSSLAHKAGNVNFDDLNWKNRKYKKWSAYGDSKIANLHFMVALQKKLINEGSQTIVVAAHPGWTSTELQRHTGLVSFFNRFFAQTPAMGALPTLRAATDNDTQANDFFGPAGCFEMSGYPKKVSPIKRAVDPEISERLFSVSEEMTGVKFH